MSAVSYLTRQGLPSLAYIKTVGTKAPGVIYCSGFLANMEGEKAKRLEELCKQRGHSFVRFDKTGIGLTQEADKAIPEMSFNQWRDDLFTVIQDLSEGPQILVGSSMGAWLSALAAEKFPGRVVGLLLLASAFDFFEGYFQRFPSEQRERMLAGETVHIEFPGFGARPVSCRILEEGKSQPILASNKQLDIHCPIRIYHGMADADASYQWSLDFCKKVPAKDVELRLGKRAEHRLNTDHDFSVISESFESLLKAVEAKTSNT